jgi:hypothetical protein
MVQGVEDSRATLNNDNCFSLHNLKELYETYNYPPYHIWNCDEFQASHNSGGKVLAKNYKHYVHGIIPKALCEWRLVLA